MAAPTSLVMTILGPDRPGLIESIAREVKEHEGNWVESRMAHLAGQFAGIIRVEVPADRSQQLRRSLEGLNLSITVAEDSSAPSESRQLVTLDLVGQDRPGIIHQITRALKEEAVNVEELESECVSAPMSGEAIFKVSAKLTIPETTDLSQVREKLETIAQDLMVDVELQGS